jgi:hypothetical protein
MQESNKNDAKEILILFFVFTTTIPEPFFSPITENPAREVRVYFPCLWVEVWECPTQRHEKYTRTGFCVVWCGVCLCVVGNYWRLSVARQFLSGFFFFFLCCWVAFCLLQEHHQRPSCYRIFSCRS